MLICPWTIVPLHSQRVYEYPEKVMFPSRSFRQSDESQVAVCLFLSTFAPFAQRMDDGNRIMLSISRASSSEPGFASLGTDGRCGDGTVLSHWTLLSSPHVQ